MKTPQEGSAISRAKVLLIVGLVATLASLWVPTFLSIGDPARTDPAGASPTAPPPRRPRVAATSTAADENGPRPLAIEVSLDQTLGIDPFRMPSGMSQTEQQQEQVTQAEEQKAEEKENQDRESRRTSLAKVLSQRVSLIVETDNGPAARLGTKLIRVGDDIEGFKVEKITKDGIYLSSEQGNSP